MDEFRPGYPIDLRPAAIRSRAERSTVGDFEYAAARVVARFTGHRVVIQDDNSVDGMADVRIEPPDAPAAYLEVVLDIEDPYAAMTSHLRGDQRIAAPELGRVWQVTVGRKANVKRLRQQLVEKLEGLQSEGQYFDTVQGERNLLDHPSARVRQLATLGVLELTSGVPTDGSDGRILVWGEGTGGPAVQDWVAFDRWLKDYLHDPQRADVRQKLAATAAPERHVFVGMSFTTEWFAYHALSHEYADLPPADPQLPSEITHVWIWSKLLGRCIAWSPGNGWFEPGRNWATE
jgi:hypothetical protein